MKIRIHQVFFLILVIFSGISANAQPINIGPIQEVYSLSHALDSPSTNPNIQMKWMPPLDVVVDGYYVMFNTVMSHQFNEFNSADEDVILTHETQITSPDFSHSDDVGVYFHIAAFALDSSDNEYIGPTTTIGPFRIDTVAPLLPVVTAPKATQERMFTLLLGAYHATEMYISNIGYGKNGYWEPFSAQCTWELREIQGNQMIYVVYRDLAGNQSKTSTVVRYDTERPIPVITSSATIPARSIPIGMTITFSEPVIGFTQSDIVSDNCQIQDFNSDGIQLSSLYTFNCIPQFEGEVSVSVIENLVQDEAGNMNQTGNSFIFIYDTSRPEIQPIPDQFIIENTHTEPLFFQIKNSKNYNGPLTINAWSDLRSLVEPQDIVINGDGNPVEITLAAEMAQSVFLSITPQRNQSGNSQIHVMVSDATGITAHTAFQLDVWDRPDISYIPDLQMDESTEFSFGIALTDVYKQNLNVSLTSSNPNLLGINHVKLIGNTVLGAKFPYVCQTSNQPRISLTLHMVPPPYENGTVDLTLTATNSKDLSITQSFTVTIQPVNDSPELSIETSANCYEDSTISMPVTITDVDQNDLIVSAIASNSQLLPENRMQWILKTNVYFNPVPVSMWQSKTQDLVLKISPAANEAGQTTVTVRVEDDGELFMEKHVLLNIYPVNDAPMSPESLSLTLTENAFSGTVIGHIPANDVDNSILTYSIDSIEPKTDFQLNPSTGDVIVSSIIDYETIPVYEMIAVITDGNLTSTTHVTIAVKNMNDNAPILADRFEFSIDENTPVGSNPYTLIASDKDGDPLSFSIDWQTVPNPFEISPNTGQIWICDTVDYETNHLYKASVTVSDGENSETSTLTITVINIKERPTITGTPEITIAQGDLYEFQPIALDQDQGDQLTFYINNQPDWADFDIQTGKLYGKPQNQHVGVWSNIILSVRDTTNLYASLPIFSITVTNTNDAPILNNPIADASVLKLSNLSLIIPSDTFIDVDPGDVLKYETSLIDGTPLPEWLHFDPIQRRYYGTPGILDGGVLNIQYTAIDSYQAATSDAFLLTVVDLNQAPQVVLPGVAIDFDENSPAVIIDSFARVTDDDSSNFDQGYLWVSFDNGGSKDDYLTIKDYGFGNTPIGLDNEKIYAGTQLIGSFSGGSGGNPLTIAFLNWADKTIVQSVLRNIMFYNDSENPSDIQRKLEFKISDGDGGTSLPVYKLININSINDDPVLILNDEIIEDSIELTDIQEDQSLVFNNENENRIQIDDKDAVNGILTTSITAIKGTLTLNPLNIDNLSSVSGNKTSNVSISGTLSQINAVLDGLLYKSRNNEFGQETLTVYMKDNGNSGNGGGQFIYRTIVFTISGENDPPQLSSISQQVLTEDEISHINFFLTETDQEDVVIHIQSLNTNIIPQESLSLSGPQVTEISGEYFINTAQISVAALTLTVTPDNDKTGSADILITASDDTYTITAQIQLIITPVNDAPIAYNQSFMSEEDNVISKTLSTYDADGDVLQILLITPPRKGTVVIHSDSKVFTYTPQTNYYGQDFFTYQAKDTIASSNIGRIDITISPVNDPPVIDEISDQTIINYQTKTITFSVTDVDSTFQVSVQSDNTQLFPNHPANLALIQNGGEYSLRLDPSSGQFGMAHITLTAEDIGGESTQTGFDIWVKSADDQGPVITLMDSSIIQIDQNTEYSEPGYVAIDDIDGTITQSVVTDTNLDIHTPGIYYISYRVSDQAGNTSDPTERLIIVNSNQFPSTIISGNVKDETGGPLGWVDVTLEGQGKTHTAISMYDGFFELSPPVLFDGSNWRITFSRTDLYSHVIEFSEPVSFDNITLFSKDSQNIDIINGQCFKHLIDGSRESLPQVTIYARSTLTNEILSTTFSDNSGNFLLTVDIRNQPYKFEAVKYGYITKSFDHETASSVVMIPITSLIIEKPEHMTDHSTARDMDKVSFSVRAAPSFQGTPYELIIEPLTRSSQTPVKLPFSVDRYPIVYNAYEDFSLVIQADTSEDQDARSGYFVTKNVYFKALSPAAQVAVTKGSKNYQVNEPFFVHQIESNDRSFISIDRNVLSGLNAPKELRYTIRDYTFPLDDEWYDHIVEFEISDELGRDCAKTTDNTEKPCNIICLGFGFEPPVTQNGLLNKSYEIIRANTVQDYLNGNYESLSDVSQLNIYEENVTFCTSNIGAYGFRKNDVKQTSSSDDGSGGGCFLRSIFNKF